MAISDEKLMLLEQITYMDANVYKTLGWDYPGDMNQIMNNINNLSDEQLVNLDTLQVDSTDITGSEWKGILSAIKADNELSALECTGYDGKVGAFCFTNPDTNEAFVTFRGTMDENGEWKAIEAKVVPDWPESDAVFIQPHNGEFIFSFPKVTTTAVRVIGDDAVLIHWNKYTKDVSAFISITELQVYEAK